MRQLEIIPQLDSSSHHPQFQVISAVSSRRVKMVNTLICLTQILSYLIEHILNDIIPLLFSEINK